MERDRAYLLDIMEAAQRALEYVVGVTREDFLENQQLQDAVVRRLEIIGEAARRTSVEMKDRHPSLPWREMIGMRNLLIHEYDFVDAEILWQTLSDDLQPLIQAISGIIDG